MLHVKVRQLSRFIFCLSEIIKDLFLKWSRPKQSKRLTRNGWITHRSAFKYWTESKEKQNWKTDGILKKSKIILDLTLSAFSKNIQNCHEFLIQKYKFPRWPYQNWFAYWLNIQDIIQYLFILLFFVVSNLCRFDS